MSKHITPNSKYHAQGATLIEVLVSVFLLTFGVLGLMAAQIRSVAALSEAENRSIVAQAADNLSDSMQMNPEVIQLRSGTADLKVIVRRYPNYVKTGAQTVAMDGSVKFPTDALWGDWSSGGTQSKSNITKKALADYQIGLFEYALAQVPNATSMQYVICQDKKNPDEPVFDANGKITNPNCTPKSNDENQTVIKVVWATRAEREDAQAVVYTYQIRVPN